MKYAIIAAGEGSRLAQEGVARPKPLVELNGIVLLDRLINIFCKNNAESISIIVNEEMTEVHHHIESLNLSIPLHVIVKSTPSSMHSFYELRESLQGGKFCLTTVDTIFLENEFGNFIEAFENYSEGDGMMAVTDFIDDEKPLYVATDQSLRITDFLDSIEGDIQYISGGIYCLNSKAIQTLENCLAKGMSRMRNYQRQLIKDGLTLMAYPFQKIIDVDHADDIKKAEAFLTQKD